ncbi:glycerol ethanol, ferric requiring protein [Allomyces arbusculus]|nr:glycerol ethanol, ferric requiring protein [Allomyces arbusculus]
MSSSRSRDGFRLVPVRDHDDDNDHGHDARNLSTDPSSWFSSSSAPTAPRYAPLADHNVTTIWSADDHDPALDAIPTFSVDDAKTRMARPVPSSHGDDDDDDDSTAAPHRRYDQFSTLDWMHHVVRERARRARRAHARRVQAWRRAGTVGPSHWLQRRGSADLMGAGPLPGGGIPGYDASDVWDDMQAWGAVTVTGILVGCVAAWLGVTLEWASDLKTGFCKPYPYLNQKKCCWQNWDADGTCDDWHEWSYFFLGLHSFFPINFVFYIAWAVLFAAASAFLVITFAPEHGPGSGIPQIKTMLGGFMMPGVLSLQTGLTKCMGLILSVASGLSIGNKAPLVHIAACIGRLVSRMFPRYRDDHAGATYLLSCAASAGIAVAFGSPIGGILYALEEVATFFPLPVMGMSFFCCLVATLTLQAFDPFKTGTMVAFQVTHNREWHLFELVPFVLVAVVGGLLGAAFNKWFVRIQLGRQQSMFCRNHPIQEAALLALVTAAFSYLTSFSRYPMLSLLGGLFRECKEENYHGMCNSDSLVWTCILLLYTVVIRFVTSVVTFGCQVPAGMFVPAMAIGAAGGRILGIMVSEVQSNFPEWPVFASCQFADRVCVTPGSYALLGAAAALTGVTRMTISIVVILFELTGALNFVLPTILVVVVAKFVADLVGGRDGLANLTIQLRGYPFLDPKDADRADPVVPFPLGHVMTPAENLVVLHNGMAVAQVRAALDRMPVGTFPIVDDPVRMGLEGCITRQDLEYALATSTTAARYPNAPVYFVSPVPATPGHASSDKTRLGTAGAASSSSATAHAATRLATPETSTWFLPSPTATAAAPASSSSSSTTTASPVIYVDVRSFTDATPLALPPTAPAALAHQLFCKLGLRYVYVKHAGRLCGLVTKKDMVRAAHAAQGTAAALQRERDQAPVLDPLIEPRVRQLAAVMGRASAAVSRAASRAPTSLARRAAEWSPRVRRMDSVEQDDLGDEFMVPLRQVGSPVGSEGWGGSVDSPNLGVFRSLLGGNARG